MQYEKIKYPDGQISAKINLHNLPLYINERINSYEDLFFVRSIVDAARCEASVVFPSLFIPCLFGQRSDRRFIYHQSFDLKLICDVINSCNFSNVLIFDPHSEVSLALINNSAKMSSFEFVQRALEDINSDTIFISPDAGSYKKVFEYGEKLGKEVIAAVKHRDLNGNINLKFIGDVEGKDCLIVDDICDGGYTFILLSKALKEQGANKIFLYISHGYFSKGFEELEKTIDHIYCTNSVKDIDHPLVTQYKVI